MPDASRGCSVSAQFLQDETTAQRRDHADGGLGRGFTRLVFTRIVRAYSSLADVRFQEAAGPDTRRLLCRVQL